MSGGILIAVAAQKPPAPPPAPPAKIFERQWNHTIGAPGQLGIAASAQRVFVTDDETGVEARAVGDGALAWQQSLPSDLPVAVAADQVYVASARQIHALDEATGRVRGARPLPGPALSLVAQGSGALTAAGSTVQAWSNDGSLRWESQLPAAVLREVLAADGSQIYVGLTDYTLVALDAASGVAKWTEKIGTLPIALTVTGGRIFFGGTDHRLHAYNRNGGESWTFKRQYVIGAPAVDDRYVYATLWDSSVVAFDLGNGHLKWRRPLDDRPIRGPMLSGPHIVTVLRSDQVVAMPRQPAETATPAASPAATESVRNRAWVATPSVDGTQVFAVIQLETGTRVVVAYKRT